MNASQRPSSRWWIAALYTLSFTLIVLPLWDGLGRLGDPAPSQVMWRAASVISVTGVLMIPVAGYVLALVTARLAEHRVVQLVGGVLGLVGALLMLGAMVFVSLDAIQMRRQVVPERLATYDRMLVRTVVSLVLFTATTAMAGMAALRDGRLRQSAMTAASEPAVIAKRRAATS